MPADLGKFQRHSWLHLRLMSFPTDLHQCRIWWLFNYFSLMEFSSAMFALSLMFLWCIQPLCAISFLKIHVTIVWINWTADQSKLRRNSTWYCRRLDYDIHWLYQSNHPLFHTKFPLTLRNILRISVKSFLQVYKCKV